uniref:Uncharacterized protein n=1 Tax=Anguilla anguilla TaxID=7936 RepID=A0A0E9VAI0_ANGAN
MLGYVVNVRVWVRM